MKALKCLLILLSLIIVSCESATEPQDCAGVAGGTAVTDCAGVCGGGDYGSQCLDGSYECNLDDCPAPTAAGIVGTYNLSSYIVHPGGDCSDDNGASGICFPPAEIAVSESDCVETDTAMCMNANTGDGEIVAETSEAADACTGDDEIWIIFGWNLWTNIISTMTITFSDDGTYTYSDDESGTWTLDGTTLTMTDSEDEVITATVSGNTLTAEVIDAIISDVDCAVMVFTK